MTSFTHSSRLAILKFTPSSSFLSSLACLFSFSCSTYFPYFLYFLHPPSLISFFLLLLPVPFPLPPHLFTLPFFLPSLLPHSLTHPHTNFIFLPSSSSSSSYDSVSASVISGSLFNESWIQLDAEVKALEKRNGYGILTAE